MKVLVIGATGFIGFPVARALDRAGHTVYGLTRSESKAKQLAAEEITPIVGEPEKPEKWISIVSALDCVINAVGGATIHLLGQSLFEAVTEAAKTRFAGMPKLAYIYTSGSWIHGDNRKEYVTETSPLTKPAVLVSWRPALEQAIVSSPALNGIIIRPALLYGGSGSILALLFGAAAGGKIRWPGTPGGRYATIHYDDLADLYLRMAEKAPLVRGLIFEGANNQTESVDDLLEKLVAVSGAQGPYEYSKPSNPFEEAIASTVLVRPYLARDLLGWEPRKAGLVDGLETYLCSMEGIGGAGCKGELASEDILAVKVPRAIGIWMAATANMLTFLI